MGGAGCGGLGFIRRGARIGWVGLGLLGGAGIVQHFDGAAAGFGLGEVAGVAIAEAFDDFSVFVVGGDVAQALGFAGAVG